MENFEKSFAQPEKREKPPYLYHASVEKNLKKIDPRAVSFRDQNEGNVVFAAPDRALATTFLIKAGDDWTERGKINGVYYMAINGKDRFMENDHGGTIYKLPSESFSFNPDKGMRENEWTSNEAVVPIESTDQDSALEAMIDNDVQVYFVDDNTFNKLCNIPSNDNPGAEISAILKNIESENQKRGKNIIPFDHYIEEKE